MITSLIVLAVWVSFVLYKRGTGKFHDTPAVLGILLGGGVLAFLNFLWSICNENKNGNKKEGA
jgi:hypothetical protein